MLTLEVAKTKFLIIANGECTGIFADEVETERFRQGVENSARSVRNALVKQVGIPEDNIATLNNLHTDQVVPAITELAGEATADDPLEAIGIYYIGHGTLSPSGLVLINSSCDVHAPELQGVAVGKLHDALHSIPSIMKILILDCCHGGAGLAGLIRQEHVSQCSINGRTGLHGGYGIAAASEGLSTLLPANERRTVFSKAFCEVLTNGIDSYEYLLSIDSLFREVRKKVESADSGMGMGRPLRVSSVDDEQIAVCVNRAVEPKTKPGKALEALANRVLRHRQEIEKLNSVISQRKRETDLQLKDIENRVTSSAAFRSLKKRQNNTQIVAMLALLGVLWVVVPEIRTALGF